MAIDKLGKCPSCGTNWDAGDIHAHIGKMEVFTGRRYEHTLSIAGKLGYSPNNKNSFTKVRVHELLDGTVLLECPNIRCGHVFNMETEKEWGSMYEYHKASKVEVLKPKDYVVGVDPYKKEEEVKSSVTIIGKMSEIATEYEKTMDKIHNLIINKEKEAKHVKEKQVPDSRRIIFNNNKRRWGR